MSQQPGHRAHHCPPDLVDIDGAKSILDELHDIIDIVENRIFYLLWMLSSSCLWKNVKRLLISCLQNMQIWSRSGILDGRHLRGGAHLLSIYLNT